MKSKVFALLVAACLSITAVASAAEPVEIRWLTSVYTDDTVERIIGLVNEKLAELDPPLRIVFPEYRGEFYEYMDAQLADQTMEYDLMDMPSGMFYRNAARGNLAPLAPALGGFPLVQDTVKPETWKLATLGDMICGIPTDAICAMKDTTMMLPAEDFPEPPEDVQDVLDWIVKRNQEDGSVLLDVGAEPPFFLHETYSEWPFDVEPKGVFYFDGEGNVTSYIESPIFVEDSGWMGAFRDAGVLTEEDGPNVVGILGSGYSERVFSNIKDYQFHSFPPNGPYIAEANRLYHVIPAGIDPEPVLRFFEWLYSDMENYRLFVHGILGETYELNEYGIAQKILDEDGWYVYSATFDFQLGMEDMDNYDEEILEQYDEFLAQQVVMPFSGFEFDPAPVQAEYDELLLAMDGGLYAQIRDGFLGLSNLDEAIDELRDANLDIVVAECQRQYDAFKDLVDAHNR